MPSPCSDRPCGLIITDIEKDLCSLDYDDFLKDVSPILLLSTA